MNLMRTNCTTCNKATLHTEYKPKWLLHIMLCLFTGGLWLLVVLYKVLKSMSFKPTCMECGTTK